MDNTHTFYIIISFIIYSNKYCLQQFEVAFDFLQIQYSLLTVNFLYFINKKNSNEIA